MSGDFREREFRERENQKSVSPSSWKLCGARSGRPRIWQPVSIGSAPSRDQTAIYDWLNFSRPADWPFHHTRTPIHTPADQLVRLKYWRIYTNINYTDIFVLNAFNNVIFRTILHTKYVGNQRQHGTISFFLVRAWPWPLAETWPEYIVNKHGKSTKLAKLNISVHFSTLKPQWQRHTHSKLFQNYPRTNNFNGKARHTSKQVLQSRSCRPLSKSLTTAHVARLSSIT